MDGRMEVGIGASTLLSVCRDDYLLLLLLKKMNPSYSKQWQITC